MKYLSRYFDVYLGTFVDDDDDMRYIDALKRYATDHFVARINPASKKWKSLAGLLSNKPFSLEYYASADMQAWVNRTIRQNGIKCAHVMTSPMAQFVENHTQLDRVIDFVDLDSEKWKQLARQRAAPVRWLLRREHALLSAYENRIARLAKQVFFASNSETQNFNRRNAITRGKTLGNGVDTRYFDPNLTYANPYPGDRKIIVFTGVMNYWINIEAVTWFTDDVLPRIIEQRPDTLFYIVGAKPRRRVASLSRNPNVVVTGRVEDVRPYLKFADVAVVPVKTECGFKNKLIEALAMERPVVATPAATSCLIPALRSSVRVEDDAGPMATGIIALLQQSRRAAAPALRARLKEDYAWDRVLAPLHDCFGACHVDEVPGVLETTA